MRRLNVSLLLQDISQSEAARSQERQKYGHLPSAPFLSWARARRSGPRMVPGRNPAPTAEQARAGIVPEGGYWWSTVERPRQAAK